MHSVRWVGFAGKSNGELLDAAESAGYDVLLTVDCGLPHQQSLRGRKISILAIQAPSNQIEDLLPKVDAVTRVLERISAGTVKIV